MVDDKTGIVSPNKIMTTAVISGPTKVSVLHIIKAGRGNRRSKSLLGPGWEQTEDSLIDKLFGLMKLPGDGIESGQSSIGYKQQFAGFVFCQEMDVIAW